MRGELVATRRIVPVAVALFFLFQITLALRQNINWDEYLFLAWIHAFADARLTEPFQTFHVHLLLWLTGLPLTEADQIVAGRLFMVLCEAGSLACLYRLARTFVQPEHALVAVLCWCSAGFALAHGASFRADPLAGFLAMAAITILACGRPRWPNAGLAGIVYATGLLVTVKAAFFLPAFLGAIIWRASALGARDAVRHFAIAAVTGLVAYATLWRSHAASLPPASPVADLAAHDPGYFEKACNAFETVILSQSFLPRADYLFAWLGLSLFALILCLGGLYRFNRSDKPNAAAPSPLAMLLFVAPLATLLFYRNGFPYFFPFILLPAALVGALGSSRLKPGAFRLVIIAGMTAIMLLQVPARLGKGQSAQREIARVVHRLFPEPVKYIDRSSMIPSFPKVGLFMSTWGMESYLAGRQNAIVAAVVRHQPPLLLLNSPILSEAVDRDEGTRDCGSTESRLRPSDEAVLRDNYIKHWGPVWVAGKTLNMDSTTFEILIGGTYTLECRGGRTVDGQTLACGSAVALAEGQHDWRGGHARLRWGSHLEVPKDPVPQEPSFYCF
jgi:hypothetical protein